MLPLSVRLQEKSRDLASAVKHFREIVDTLQEKRKYAEISFSEILRAAEKLAKEFSLLMKYLN